MTAAALNFEARFEAHNHPALRALASMARGRFFSTSSFDSFWSRQDALGAMGSFDLGMEDLLPPDGRGASVMTNDVGDVGAVFYDNGAPPPRGSCPPSAARTTAAQSRGLLRGRAAARAVCMRGAARG